MSRCGRTIEVYIIKTLTRRSSLVSNGNLKSLEILILSEISPLMRATIYWRVKPLQLEIQRTSEDQPQGIIELEGYSKNISKRCIFPIKNPLALKRKVFFEVMLFLCRCVRENLRSSTKNSFSIKKDGEGEELVVDELTKNHRQNDGHLEGGVIYATEEANCPVESFKLYICRN